MLENGRLKQIKHSSDSNKRFKGRRECGVFRVKHTKNICSAINENNLPSRATTSSRESNSRETQFFPDVQMESLNETGYKETRKDLSY